MIPIVSNSRGFTLVELVIVIAIIGIVVGVATVKLNEAIDDTKVTATSAEMQALAYAIVGNPDIYSDGTRSDFGYVGDVGALPLDLDALYANPGGYSTWEGPYIGSTADPVGYKTDGWNVAYIFSDTLLRSTGSGSNMDKIFAPSSAALLANQVSGVVLDANSQAPQASFRDSVVIILSYPDGAGGMSNSSINPDADGSFTFSNIPIGNHTLRVIAVSDSDTMTYAVAVNPGKDVSLNIIFPADLF
jgi:prepilin-type N-terminal cleavage/methylation domain-containing protein